MSRQICLTFLETLQSLSSREAILAALPGLLEPWGLMVYDPSSSQGTAVYEGPDIVARLAGEDAEQTQALVGLLSHLLGVAAERREAQLCHGLTRLLKTERSLEQALELILAALHSEAGAMLEQRGSQFETLAKIGRNASDSTSLTMNLFETEQAWLVAKHNQAHYSTPLTLCPIGHSAPARTLLLVYRESTWTQADKTLLETACTLLHAWQGSQRSRDHLETILDLERTGLEAAPDELFQRVLEAAVKTVPGAEAGSLLIRQGDTFRFSAALGFDLATLRQATFKASDMQVWHAHEGTAWSWEARIVKIDDTFLDRVSDTSNVPEALQRGGRLDEIKANLYVPIVYQGELLAVLNLDNFHDKEAFAEDSLQAARRFGSPVAVVLRERHYRYLLEQAALTDALTGVGNRRAFEFALKQEIARSAHHQETFCLLALDLSNFKTINDTLGHSQGDLALIQVAKTLQHIKRRSDTVFRLGGDEFAVLLPQTDYEGGIIAARRYARAIKRIEMMGHRLGVNIGGASFPKCASSQEALLELADTRMYSAKSAGHSVYYEPTVDCEAAHKSSLDIDLAFETPGEDDATFVLA
jgi:diguanylate cyclase (GGDEF)-like protein